MIEMQWVKPVWVNDMMSLEESGKCVTVGGTPLKLQFREVLERREAGRVIIATEWQDVKIGEST